MRHSKTINSKAIYEHTKQIFSISQTIPSPAINLLQ